MEPPGQSEGIGPPQQLQEEQLDGQSQQDAPMNNTSDVGTGDLSCTGNVPWMSTSPLDISESTFTPTTMPRLLLLHGADTLVFIDPSPETVRAKLPRPTPAVPHRIHSERLLATGSTYFERLYSPGVQTRVRKQRGLAGELPDGIRYVLDLTPPMLDEDAVIFLTELSCPMSIRTWASKQKLWELPSSCVGGQDELELSERLSRDPTASPKAGIDLNNNSSEVSNEEQDKSLSRIPDSTLPVSLPKRVVQERLPVEYSASRHREGIENILHVLEGLHTSIDTPCKLWTIFALAKIFDVASAPAICDHIVSWFYQCNNARFVELHPEITYRVACGIKSPSLCQDSFVAMVGDEALLYLIHSTGFQPTRSMQTSLQSRVRDVLHDTELQPIEYASKSFSDYIVRCFLHLSGSEMPWLAGIAEFQKLTRHLKRYPGDQDIVLQLIATLKEFVRDRIYGALIGSRDTNRSFHISSTLVRSSNPYQQECMHKEFLIQRLLGNGFWGSLMSLDLWEPEKLRPVSHASIAEFGNGSLAFSDETSAVLRYVSVIEVFQMVNKFNDAVGMRVQARQEEEAFAAEFGCGRAITLTINSRQSHPTKETGGSSNNGPFLHPVPAPIPNPSVPPNPDVSDDIFNEFTFTAQVHGFLKQYAQEMLQLPDSTTIRRECTDILACLTYNEFQYLPLWAGGNDDGTGGVYTDLIIPAMDNGGFSGLGPAVHTGSVASTNDSFSEIDPSDSQSTVHAASHNATYSHVSDLLSVDSADYTLIPHTENHDEALSDIDMYESEYDDETALDLDPMTDDEGDEFQSDGTITKTMGSPSSSADFADDFDVDNLDDEDHDNDFQIVNMHKN